MGTTQPTRKARSNASQRKARRRMCLRKGCGKQYEPKRWNQRYCQDPQCSRLVRRWQAKRRQAKRRRAPEVKAQHAGEQRARRARAKAAAQATANPAVPPARGHAPKRFFFAASLRPAGVLRPAPFVRPPPNLLLWPRLPRGCPQRPGPRAQVEVPWHVSRPEEARLRICGGAQCSDSEARRETIAAG